MALKYKQGQTRVQLGVTEAGEATFNLTNPDGKARVQVVVSPEGDPLIQLISESDTDAVTIQAGGMTMQGEGLSRRLIIANNTNDISVALMFSHDQPGLLLSGAEGRVRATLQLSKDGVPVLALMDGEGNLIE